MRCFTIITSLFLFFSCNTENIKCGDLLKIYAKKPEPVIFVDCKKGKGQTILEANYIVKGEDSKTIEEFLIKNYRIGELKFTCCGWESINGKNGYINHEALQKINPNYVLKISMYGNAEKQTKNDEVIIEFDKTKINFNITVKIVEI